MATLSQKYVEVCVFRPSPKGPQYLILHRSMNEAVYPGLWQYITGSIEGEETAAAAAMRELYEETKFVPKNAWIVPYVNSFYDQRRDTIALNPVFLAEVGEASDPVLSHEHEAFEWLEIEEALGRLVWPGQHEALKIAHEFIVRGKDAAKYSRILPS